MRLAALHFIGVVVVGVVGVASVVAAAATAVATVVPVQLPGLLTTLLTPLLTLTTLLTPLLVLRRSSVPDGFLFERRFFLRDFLSLFALRFSPVHVQSNTIRYVTTKDIDRKRLRCVPTTLFPFRSVYVLMVRCYHVAPTLMF